ncbi:MAG: Sec-independent protein translocase protein TatB [Xanthomonadales bacterium]|nr:Sec-independent protein translocase protein TatB [Xanthomonadales bacterium]
MFDVGFAEILLLSLIGLLVLGPERLPKVARTLGGLSRKARGSWLSLKRSIEAELRAEELKEPLKHFQKDVKSTVDEFRSGVKSVTDPKPDGAKPAAAAKSDEPDKKTAGNGSGSDDGS